VGQILDRTSETRAAQGLKVLLLQGQQAVTDTATNQHGEFQFEYEAQDQLWLSIEMDAGKTITIPLMSLKGGQME
jgi:hypothetical protein